MFDAVLLFRDALYGSIIIAVTCALLGVYVVLRRIVFVGAALAQISSAGIALAYWLAGHGIATALATHPEALSLAATLASVTFFAGTLKCPASTSTNAMFARSSRAGAVTRILRASPCIPAISVRRAPGCA